MKPRTITLTGSGSGTTNTDPLRVNWRTHDVSLGFDTDGSTTGFTVQYTLTSPAGYASGSAWATGATWYNHATLATMTADAAGNLDFPVHGVRLQANATGTDTGTLTVIQGV